MFYITSKISKISHFVGDGRGRNSQDAFIIYLQRSGVYPTYLMSITKAASIIVNDQFSYSGESNRNSKQYQVSLLIKKKFI